MNKFEEEARKIIEPYRVEAKLILNGMLTPVISKYDAISLLVTYLEEKANLQERIHELEHTLSLHLSVGKDDPIIRNIKCSNISPDPMMERMANALRELVDSYPADDEIRENLNAINLLAQYESQKSKP